MANKQMIGGDSVDEQKVNMGEILEPRVTTVEREDKILNNNHMKSSDSEAEESYITVFHGDAMDSKDLLPLSSRTPINMIMVAGPFASGKTTLMVMMYHFFREGLNETLMFRGTRTMQGFAKRSKMLMQYSAKDCPDMERTSLKSSDCFLHLAVVDHTGKESDLVFADISGERFSEESYIKEMSELFSDIDHLIVVIDMEKIKDKSERRNVGRDTKSMLSQLLKYHILSKTTMLQVVCTKMDSLGSDTESEEHRQYAMKIYSEIEKYYINEVSEIKLCFVSALNLDDQKECKNIEKILHNCTLKSEGNINNYTKENTMVPIREFDKYGLRR